MNRTAVISIIAFFLVAAALRPAARKAVPMPQNPKGLPDTVTVVFDSINQVNGVINGDSVTFVPGDTVKKDSISIKPPTRRITPVDIDDNKPKNVLHYYDKHGEPLEEPVMFLATLDTVTKAKSKPVYPLYNGMSIGVNFADAVLMIAGQKHASFDIWADVSLHNWFFPVVELGMGYAKTTPENQNFTYKGKPSFYAKAGMNYNFLYKSETDYQAFAGFRLGYSSFSYDLENVSISNGYWDESQTIDILNQKASALYGEVLAGLKVKIYKNFSLGWNIKYHFKLHTSSKSASTPWFIPGYGTSSPLSFSFSAIYSFGQKPKREPDAADAAATKK